MSTAALLRTPPGANLGGQMSASDELLDYCAVNNLPLVAYSPLLSGAYTRAERPLNAEYQAHNTAARLAPLRALAREVGATTNQVVLA